MHINVKTSFLDKREKSVELVVDILHTATSTLQQQFGNQCYKLCKFITCCKTSKCENIILELIHSCESSVSTQHMKPWKEFLYFLKHVELFQSLFDSDSIEHTGKQEKRGRRHYKNTQDY